MEAKPPFRVAETLPYAANVIQMVSPIPHKTYWRRAAAGLSILALFAAAHSLRMRYLTHRLRKQSDEQLRITRELHDTLLQSIHGLMLHFHFATEALPRHEPAREALLAALSRADAVFAGAQRRIEQLRDEASGSTKLPD
jgi:signal transduction histidine kinase